MRLLVVEDEPNVARILAKGLREQAYAVDAVADGDAAVERAGTTEYDAIILDVMLPGASGFDVCRTLRGAGYTTPILILTARDAVNARIEGLDAGADDYLLKPFDFGELLARLRALIRRGRGPLLPDRLEIGGVVLDARGRRVTVKGREVPLTSKEYALLEYLARRHGDVAHACHYAERSEEKNEYDGGGEQAADAVEELAFGVGNLFGQFLQGALRNPSAADGQFGRLIFGFAVTEALGIFALLVAFLLLFT